MACSVIPVIPPQVPYQPYVAPTVYHKGQAPLKGLIKIDHIPSDLHLALWGRIGFDVLSVSGDARLLDCLQVS